MIAPGTILIRNDTHLPGMLLGVLSPFSVNWSFLADNAGRQALEKRLAASGLTSSYLAGSIRRAAAGVDQHSMIEAALQRVLAGAKLQSCNFRKRLVNRSGEGIACGA